MLAYKKLGYNGRLGNQLWEIASTYGIAAKTGEHPAFSRDWKYRDIFCVPSDLYFHPETVAKWPDVLDSAFLEHIPEAARSYMQDVSLFSHVSHEIASMFLPTTYAANHVHDRFSWYFELPRPILAVHVRRGDNVEEGEWKKAYYPVPTVDYYQKAIESHVGLGSIVFFSDDIPWCKDHWVSTPGVHFFEGGARMPKEHEPEYEAAIPTDWIDLLAMSAADEFVLSNSTFGWWGAWLSGSREVTYVKPWYGPELSYIDSSLMFTGLRWSERAY